MALKVRDAGAAAKKFADRGAAALPDYQAGVRGAGADWQRAAEASTDNYNAGVQAAIARGAFGKGIRNSGAAYYEQRATELGGRRFADGIRAGAANWEEGTKPYLDTLKGLNLPPRGPKGDPRNMQRAQDVAMALRRAKTGE